MGIIRVTKEFSFEMAHMLTGYDGMCSEIHGHSYRLFVTVAGQPCTDPANPKYGMVMDFGILKKIVSENIIDRFDHATLLLDRPENTEVAATLNRRFDRIRMVDYQPTCENLVEHFSAILMPALPEEVVLHSLRLNETATSYAEWFRSDNAE